MVRRNVHPLAVLAFVVASLVAVPWAEAQKAPDPAAPGQAQQKIAPRAVGDTRARHALVIGNADYTGLSRLANPGNDARDIAAALIKLEFDVELLEDADLQAMEDAVVRFGNRLGESQGAIGFFYYAGHGVQSGGINYLVPVDARIGAESFLKTRALAVQSILDTLQASRNGLNVVVLDACRDNPFSWARSGTRGLSVVGSQPSSSIIVYATGAGSVAQDGSGRNGVFTAELLKNLTEPGLEINEVFRRTGRQVSTATNGGQVPAVYSQYFDSAYLAGFSGPVTTVQDSQSKPTITDTSKPVVTPVPVVLEAASELRARVALLRTEGSAVVRSEESIRGYAGQIAMLEGKLTAIGVAFTELTTSEKARIEGEFKAKKTEAEVSEMEPWETDAEYAARKSALVVSAESERVASQATLASSLLAEQATAEKDLKQAVQKAADELGAKTWTLKGAQVRLESLPFEREAKIWPLKLSSQDAALEYSGRLDYSMKDVADIAKTYRGFEAQLKAGQIDGEISFGFERVAGKDIIQALVKGLRIVDRKTNKVVASATMREIPYAIRVSDPSRRVPSPRLRVESEPAGAELSLKGRVLGTTPLEFTAPPGESVFVATWKDEDTATLPVRVTLEYGETRSLNLKKPAYEMIFVDGGNFFMGNDVSKESDEKPVHTVTLSSFLIGLFEITQGQYQELMGYNPSLFASVANSEQLPVDQVSWYEAVEFCNRLSEREGLAKVYTITGRIPSSAYPITSATVTMDMTKNGYRLPTESEWEYAAHGGKLSKEYTYAGSNDPGSVAWHEGNSEKVTHAAGTKQANELGLYDMSGNVWEWCWDWYGNYQQKPLTDPTGVDTGTSRVIRGGSWNSMVDRCRDVYRGISTPGNQASNTGFRLVRRP